MSKTRRRAKPMRYSDEEFLDLLLAREYLDSFDRRRKKKQKK